ncbi:hypothetical protein H4582DRAFT_1942786 [Lactarius indigo]|nr:hypothetical protein H4582DRAFT_1942786 [Lactarius indigo]
MFNGIEIYEDEDEVAAAALFAIVTTSILSAREARNEQRRPHSLYLCRRELLPNPHAGTPWQRLWESQEDRAFITTMGFDVATFRLLLEGPGRFGEHWENTPIPRNDVSIVGAPRLASRSLDGAGALGLVLHYLGSAMLEVSLQQIFALTPSVLSRYLEFAENILYDVLLHTGANPSNTSLYFPMRPQKCIMIRTGPYFTKVDIFQLLCLQI